VLGYATIFSSIIQVGIGIDLLYPWIDPRSYSVWAIYLGLLVFWGMSFLGFEIYYRQKIKRQDKGYTAVSTVLSDISMQEFRNKNLQKFSWSQLNDQVRQGQMLVVGNGKYVYDISKWILSHPGGQIILHSVNGTDITNDYFHEAGYDANEFTPIATAPINRNHVDPVVTKMTRADLISLQRQTSLSSHAGSAIGPSTTQINFSNEDWTLIQRARRTHVHTKLAIERLASLVIGEIETQSFRNGSCVTIDSDERQFDIYEYRRYAITKFDLESPPNATNPFVRLRFCLLYPYDTRSNQPKQFLPGQCIEIEVRLSDGSRISRYYTPIEGNLNAFDVMIKIKPGGKISQYLFKAQKGERQFKIRGPFGTPLLPTISLTSHKPEYFNTIYFFAGGSGITPFLHLANYMYLHTNHQTKVYDYLYRLFNSIWHNIMMNLVFPLEILLKFYITTTMDGVLEQIGPVVDKVHSQSGVFCLEHLLK
jgi:hypothetical protein